MRTGNVNSSASIALPRAFVTVWLALLLAVGVYIRVDGMSDWHYSVDESIHAHLAEAHSLGEAIQFSRYEAHPPLANILRYFWVQFSTDPAFVRSEALLFGLALILLHYRTGVLLGGPLAGMCCAALAAFSFGMIIQTYIVRVYAFFVFFLSAAFYFYARWLTRGYVWRDLTSYAACLTLACLTHFTGAFAVACFGAHGALCLLLRKRGLRTFLIWGAVNAAIFALALYVYYLWQPVFAPLKGFLNFILMQNTLGQRIAQAIVSPVTLLVYPLSPNPVVYMLLLLPLLIFTRGEGKAADKAALRPWLGLAGLMFAETMALIVTGIYTPIGGRHTLWTYPFLVPVAGLLLAILCARVCLFFPRIRPQMMAMLVFLAGWALFNDRIRFADHGEYMMPQAQFDSLTRYLATLTPADLIVTERDDGIILMNFYPHEGDDAFSGKVLAKNVPYRHTHILFNPYYVRDYTRDVFLEKMRDAETRGLLAGADRLVFFITSWSRSPVMGLLTCAALDKTVITFPPEALAKARSRVAFQNIPATLLLVRKQAFLDDVLAPVGKARGCLSDGK